MINKQQIKEITDFVKEAFDDMLPLGTELEGIYNFIRYCNEDFGEDMYINEPKPITDNSFIQHCYLIIYLFEILDRGLKPGESFITLYQLNKDKYSSILGLEKKIEHLNDML